MRHASRQLEQGKSLLEIHEFLKASNLATSPGYYFCICLILILKVRELLMKKIAIVGSPGAGKTTLAKELGSRLEIKVFHLDRIFWQRGWKEKPRDKRIDILEKIVQEKQWIIEGTYLSSSEPRLSTADTIIFLDIDSSLCLQRIMKRHFIYQGHPRRDIPEGCTDKLNLLRILKVLVFPFRGRRTLVKKLRNYKSKQIIWLCSPKEVENFLARLEPHVDEKRQFSKPISLSMKTTLIRSKTIAKLYQLGQLLNRFEAHLNRVIKGTLHDNIITPWANSDSQWYADVLRASRTRRATGITAWVHRLKQ